jgi:hypothetical protein
MEYKTLGTDAKRRDAYRHNDDTRSHIKRPETWGRYTTWRWNQNDERRELFVKYIIIIWQLLIVEAGGTYSELLVLKVNWPTIRIKRPKEIKCYFALSITRRNCMGSGSIASHIVKYDIK